MKVGLTKGSENTAHPEIPPIGLIFCGVFTFVLTAGFHDDDGDVDDVDVDADEEEGGDDHHPQWHQHHNMTFPLQPLMGWLVQELGFHQVSPSFHAVFVKPTKSQLIKA